MPTRNLTSGLGLGLAAAAAVASASYALANAALRPESQLFGSTIIAGPHPNEAALTFDDGPNDTATEALLDLLAAANTRATFFMIGCFVRQRPAIVRRVHAAGHLIGNHTETHPWLAWQRSHVIREQLQACNQAIEDATGAPVLYFRPPHGARRPAVLRIARELGLATVQWNVMAEDWRPTGVGPMLANVEQGIERCRRRGVGSNILLHDGSDRAMGTDRSDTLRLQLRRLPLYPAELRARLKNE